ncbi:unnamed protein product [Echinostoma caproni]|uniref:Retrotransposon gag domain-containing protein n=1 Tax=Echinostoma caproni TaxID=27848 RepID=A0A183B383_9TREM|nr:unnamed protein product [Echinostoma caproni]
MESCKLEDLNIHASACEVEDYLERFEIWCITRKRLDGERRTANFLMVIGKDAYSLLKKLAYPDAPISLTYESLKTLLLKHLQPANFEAFERAKFHSLTRGGSQPVPDFILQLQTQASHCSFGDQLQIQLRDRLIARNYSKSSCSCTIAHFSRLRQSVNSTKTSVALLMMNSTCYSVPAIPNSHHPDESGSSKRARKHQATSVLQQTMTNGFNDGTSAIPMVKDIRGYPVDFVMPSVTIAASLAIFNLSVKVRSRVLQNVRLFIPLKIYCVIYSP